MKYLPEDTVYVPAVTENEPDGKNVLVVKTTIVPRAATTISLGMLLPYKDELTITPVAPSGPVAPLGP